MNERHGERGYVLLAVTLLSALLMTILGAYFFLAEGARSSARSAMDSTRGYYAAEAGANLRLDALRQTFLGFNRPAGTSPPDAPGALPCQAADDGSGDYECTELSLADRDVLSYVREAAGNPSSMTIPPGELYQHLRAQEYRYGVNAVAVSADQRPEALVEVDVRARLVPLFQFAAFYNKDLEILPGPGMFFAGPIHSNGNVYLDAGTSLTIQGQVTTAGKLFRGRKNENLCTGAPVNVYDPANPQNLPHGAGSRTEITDPEVAPWNGLVRTGVDVVEVPPPGDLDPVAGAVYWDNADLRLALDLNGGPPAVEVRDVTNAVDAPATLALAGCGGAAGTSISLYNRREDANIRMLEVDVRLLMNCLEANNAIIGGKTLGDSTNGGLVFHLQVDGPDSAAVNNYGVRVKGAAELGSNVALAPEIRGLTVVTNQAIYVQGDFNSVDKKPAALMADSLNVLSNAWDDANSPSPLANRIATATTINAAFLAGTDTTGDADGPGNLGQDAGDYNGGVENYPRLHENWTGVSLTYRGSFVSLNTPRHVDGPWTTPNVYVPPNRNWGFDTDFNDAALLPPLAPRFIYLVQDRFVRNFEL